MNQFADVTRFCAIEGRLCEKHIPYQGTNTFFFAYPSGDHWRDFSEKLIVELMEQDVLGQRWEDTIGNDVLFSKVCEGIYGHDYLLAEITEPNANVLLEIGYALAVGRLPILLNKQKQKILEPRTSDHSGNLFLRNPARHIGAYPDPTSGTG